MTRYIRHLVFASLSVLALAFAVPAPALGQATWNGSTTDWNTAGNWNLSGVPNSTSTTVTFLDNSAGTVNISSSVSAASLTFNNTTTSYNLTSNASQTLTIASTSSAIVVNGATSGIIQINLANVASTGSLDFPGSNLSYTIANNSTVGGALVIGPSTVIGTPGSNTGFVFAGSGPIFLSGSFATGSGLVQGGLAKNGPGLLDFSGSGAALGGNLTLNGGLLELDYTASPPTTKLSNGALILDGGALTLLSNPSTSFVQSFGGATVAAGHTQVTGSGTGTVTLSVAAITHNVGGTVDFTPSASAPTFSIQTSTSNTNGLLGTGPAFATVNGGANWAVQSGVVVAPLAGFSTNIYLSGANTDVTANSSQSNITTNSLRFNTGPLTLTLSGTNILQSGGVLVTPNSIGGTITGGTLQAASSGELLFHIYNTGFLVGSNLVSTTGLTKTGPGTLNLTGSNTGLTGPININRGGLYITTLAAVNSASAINFNDDRTGGNLQQFTVDLGDNTIGTISPPIRLSAFSATDYGTYFTTGSSSNTSVTLGGAISSAPGLTTPIRFTNAVSDNNGFNLIGVNTFTGNVSLFQGFLGINSNASLGNAANTLSLEVGDNINGGLTFLNSGITLARSVIIGFNTRVVSNGTDSNTISGPISGLGGLIKAGTGTLTLTNSANTFTGGVTVSAGTLSFAPAGRVPAGNTITVGPGATFIPGLPNTAVTPFAELALNGGTFRVASGSGINYFVTQIFTNSSGGTIDFTSAGADQLLIVAQAGIAINGNSTWLSPTNGTTISNGFTAGDIAITIPTGVTLTNGIALAVSNGFGFHLSGGGTLFQNSDAVNAGGMTAPITVSQSTFRVTDASSNGGVGNLGAGAFTLDGGTFSYGGTTATTTKPIQITTNGGTIQVELPGTALTAAGAITGLAGLTKAGSGTLILNSAANSFTSLTINAGTIAVAADGVLGNGPISIGPLGTLTYSGTTSTNRTITMNSGTLSVAAGQALSLSGATIGGGFLRGPGSFNVSAGSLLTGATTGANTTLNVIGPASFVNFTNGSTMNIVAGPANPITLSLFADQGSGAIIIALNSQVNASDFQTYGTLTIGNAAVGGKTLLTNTGTTPLYFNGGSRTFIGVAGGNPALSGIELNGQNAIVAGGLFVNNGQVTDNSVAGISTIIADYGALVKGGGSYDNSPITQNGGKFQAGNSPGVATVGRFVFGPGGVSNYVFAIDDATGQAGPTPDSLGHVSGWGLVKAAQWQRTAGATSGDFAWTADPAHPLTVAIDTLVNPTTVGVDISGLMADFDPTKAYSWPAVEWTGTYSGPTDVASLDAATDFDTSGFANPINGTFGWSLGSSSLSLSYTPSAVPEPGTLALVGAAAAAIGWRRRRTFRTLFV